MALHDELLEVELRLWRNDPELYRDNYIPDALITFPETGVIDIGFAVDAIRQENADGRHWADVELSDVRTMAVTPDVALLLYKATARWAHEDAPVVVLATTVYVRRDGRWKAAHHQQSPA